MTGQRAPQQRIVHLQERDRRSKAITLSEFGALLADHKLECIPIDKVMVDDIVEFGAIAHGYSEDRAERLAARLSSDPHITGFEIRPQQA